MPPTTVEMTSPRAYKQFRWPPEDSPTHLVEAWIWVFAVIFLWNFALPDNNTHHPHAAVIASSFWPPKTRFRPWPKKLGVRGWSKSSGIQINTSNEHAQKWTRTTQKSKTSFKKIVKTIKKHNITRTNCTKNTKKRTLKHTNLEQKLYWSYKKAIYFVKKTDKNNKKHKISRAFCRKSHKHITFKHAKRRKNCA